MSVCFLHSSYGIMTHLAGAAVYTDCISPNECPGYDIKLSDGAAPVMLELWGM